MSASVDLAGRTAELTFEVGRDDLATALGSGDVPVLGTPRLVAWLEAATVSAVADHLTPEQTSVGTRVEVDHLAACPVGTRVVVTARVTAAEGRTLAFECEARSQAVNGSTVVLGRASITRAVVDRVRFAGRWG